VYERRTAHAQSAVILGCSAQVSQTINIHVQVPYLEKPVRKIQLVSTILRANINHPPIKTWIKRILFLEGNIVEIQNTIK